MDGICIIWVEIEMVEVGGWAEDGVMEVIGKFLGKDKVREGLWKLC